MKRFLKIVGVLLLLVLAGLAGLGFAFPDKIEIPAGSEGQYTTVEHVRIRYVQKGSGPDILLIHGAPASLEEWQPVIDRWAVKYRVTAYDRPGHGWSAAPESSTGIEYNARIAHGLLDELKIRDAMVVGHSYGGAVALRLAVDGETRASRYAVVASTVYPAERRPEPVGHLLRLPLLGRGFAVVFQQLGGKMIADGIAAAFHPEESQIPPGFIDAKRALWLQPKVTMAVAEEMHVFGGEIAEMAGRYAGIKKPVLIVAGALDRPSTVEGARQLTRAVPGSTLAVVESCGHMIQFTHADALTDLINDAMK